MSNNPFSKVKNIYYIILGNSIRFWPPLREVASRMLSDHEEMRKMHPPRDSSLKTAGFLEHFRLSGPLETNSVASSKSARKRHAIVVVSLQNI